MRRRTLVAMAIGVGLARGQHPEVAGTAAYPPFEVYVPEVDLPVDDEEYPYLLLVDPYDTTVFSSHQCGVLVREFERLAASRPDDAKLSAALELVRGCASDVGTALWFLGD